MSLSVPAEFEKEDKYDPGSFGIEDDLFLIRVPKAFDVSKLNGKRFSKRHVTEVGRDDGPGDLSTVYGSTYYKNDGIGVQPLICSQQNVILGQNIKGLVSVTKSFELCNPIVQQRADISCSNLVKMPPGLKTRFTPFGAGNPFKQSDQDATTTSLKRKLDNSLSDSLISLPPKKKKKKKHRQESEDFESINVKKRNTGDFGDIPIKPKPADVLKEEMNNTHDSGINLTENVRSSKKKKKSKHSGGSVGSELSIAYSESDLSVNSKDDCHIEGMCRQNGDRRLNAFPGTSDLDASSDSHVAGGIKMEKDGQNNSHVLDMDCSLPAQINGSISKKKKKKKDKRNNMTLP